MALLSIKMQRPADTVRFCNGKKFSSQASGNMKPGWNRLFLPSFGRGRSKAPSLSMADKREGSWREQKVEVCLLSSGGLFHVIFVYHDVLCSTFLCVQTHYWSNLYCKRTFPGCTFRSSPHPQRHFESSYRNTNSLSRLRLSGWADSVNLATLQWVDVPKPKTTGSGLLDMP